MNNEHIFQRGDRTMREFRSIGAGDLGSIDRPIYASNPAMRLRIHYRENGCALVLVNGWSCIGRCIGHISVDS
jgi:hypothetical protein